MKKTRILFVEDDLDYRYLIERELEKEKDFELCAACSDGETAVQAALLHQPDIVLMDLSLGNSALNSAEAARSFTDRWNEHRKIAFEQVSGSQRLRAGVNHRIIIFVRG